MNYLSYLECSKCGKKFETDKIQTFCPECEATLLARYELDKIRDDMDKGDFYCRQPDMWRYWELLPVDSRSNVVSLGEGFTPIHELKDLSEELGIEELLMKDESFIPTGSFKARGLAMAVSRANELGVSSVAMPSAGNAAGALSTYGALADMDVNVVMPADAPESCKLECFMTGADIYLVDGLISDAGRIIGQGVDKYGWFDVSTMKEPYRLEGKKTMGLEIAEQLGWILPDMILYPTGGGTGIIGMWKAFKELKELGWVDGEMPKMVVVQSEGCAPVVDAYHEGKRETSPWEGAETMAGGIRVPQSFADHLILDLLYESDGFAVKVSDGSIKEAAKRLGNGGFFICPEGAATLAGLEKLVEEGKLGEEKEVLLYNTGAGMKYTSAYMKELDVDIPVVSSIEDLEA